MADLERDAASKTSDQFAELSEFSSILQDTIDPVGNDARSAIDDAVSTVVQNAVDLDELVDGNVLESIAAMISDIDRQLGVQLDEILHHEEFQSLEGTWRGLAYTVDNTEMGADLQVKVFNASKDELARTMRDYRGARWDQSPLYKKIYREHLDTHGEHPFGAIIGDYYFDHSAKDVSVLEGMSKISEASLAPFISSVSPRLFGRKSWNELDEIPDLATLFSQPDYAKWNDMRDSENSRFLGLTMPRVLARAPYGEDSEMQVDEFGYEEGTDGHVGTKYSWMNAAHAMGVNINRAFREYGWTVNIRGNQGGGEVAGLPEHKFKGTSGSTEIKCPTERAIDGRREAELSTAGLLPLIHRKNSARADFIGGQSVFRPRNFVDDEATASDNLSSRLPYMFAVSRFSHFLKKMLYDRIGSTQSKDDIKRDMNDWLMQYVTLSPETASQREKAEKPLADAKIDVVEDETNPGYYLSTFYLKPHYQLEGVDVGMSLVSKVKGDS